MRKIHIHISKIIVTTAISLLSIISAHAATTVYTTKYAYSGNQVTITDPNGNVTTKTYRAFGSPDHTKQLISVARPNKVITSNQTNVIGQLKSITQGSLTRTYTYNSYGYLASVVNPETGKTVYTYDLMGNMKTSQVGSAGAVQYTYNADNQLVDVKYPDAKTPEVKKTYNADGKITEVSNSNATLSYTYDANGNLTSITTDVAGHAYKIAYTYDGNDHVATITYPNGKIISLEPNAFGQPTELSGLISKITYFPNKEIKTYSSSNSNVTTYTLSPRNILNSIQVLHGSTPILHLSYTYDGNGNITQIADALSASNSQVMTYNDMNELATAQGLWGKASMTYDGNGNFQTKSVGSQSLTYHYDTTTNRLTSISGGLAAAFAYDAYGDITQIGAEKFAYNDARQLLSVSGTNFATNKPIEAITYQYDGDGNVVSSAQNKVTTDKIYNVNNQLLFSFSPTQNVMYVYLAGQVVAEITTKDNSASTSWFSNNLLGSPVSASGSSGSLAWKQQYWPYGHEIDNLSHYRNSAHVGYTSKPFDSDTGLSDMGARYYNPIIGRFMGVDPNGVNPQSPISFNRYAYANNNPYGFIDPTGMFSVSDLWNGFADTLSNFSSGFDNTATFGLTHFKGQGPSYNVGGIFGGVFGLALGTEEAGAASTVAGEVVGADSVKALPSLQVPNAGGRIVSDVTEQDGEFFRVFSGNNTRGGFLTKVPPSSQAEAIEGLALPPGNTAEFIQKVAVPAGTRLQRSRALPAFGRRGGKEQFQLLDNISNESFGPGEPFQ